MIKFIEVVKKGGQFQYFSVYYIEKVGKNLTQTRELDISYNENVLPILKKRYRIKNVKIKEL